MKSTMNGRTSKHSLARRAAPAGPRDVQLESDADPQALHAQVELVRIQEEHKTLRTWAICGTIVAGMAIISYAAIQRHREMFDDRKL